ncbi:MAG TPA: choice-of-anchor tandem repeat GloVer-containing protein, partial [Opitutaceae bacterium]|nr:choice-of-anchor tandem repeat GloVer-containing protein [Opitutaceae bacterium]
MTPSIERFSGLRVTMRAREAGLADPEYRRVMWPDHDRRGSSLLPYVITPDRKDPMKTLKSLFVLAALSLMHGSVFAQARFTVIHDFAGGANDGANPQGDLIVSGSTCYGMTCAGGSGNMGTIFKVSTDGTGFALLHSFAGGAGDGASPYGSLTLSGTTLYGMTYAGGSSGLGTVFRINMDGTGFA